VIDPLAGIVLRVGLGDGVAPGDALATLYTAVDDLAQTVAPDVQAAITLTAHAPASTPMIYETLGL
jgi:thymidine phosphorylase